MRLLLLRDFGEYVTQVIFVVVAYSPAVRSLSKLKIQHRSILRCGIQAHTTVAHYGSASRDFVGTDEVDPAVNRPHQGDPESQQRFQFGAISHERSDPVKRHARQVRNQPTNRYEKSAYRTVLGMPVEGDHAS